MEIHGHRGARATYPENTINGFEYVFKNNIQFVELDVHLTKDKEVVVHHDFDVPELTQSSKNKENVKIKDLSLEDLQMVNVGQRRNKKTGFPKNKLNKERIPTLNEVLLLDKKYKSLNIHWEIEVKYKKDQSSDKKELVKETLDCIFNNKIEDRCTLFSFDVGVLRIVRELKPTLKINFLYDGEPLFPLVLRKVIKGNIYYPNWSKVKKVIDELEPDMFGPQFKLLKFLNQKQRNFFNKKNRKFKLITWTVNAEKDCSRLMKQGLVDGIITDRPVHLKKYLES